MFSDSRYPNGLIDESDNLIRPLFWLLITAAAVLISVFLFGYHNRSDTASLGTFGDFVGGALNPIFTFLTFLGLIVTIVIQRIELRLAREEYEKTAIALNTQAVETTFFNTVELHHKIVDGLRFVSGSVDKSLPGAPTTYAGRDVFSAIMEEIGRESSPDKVYKRYKLIQDKQNHILGHYFRNLYQALKIIDKYPDETLEVKNKRKYSGILRAQLSSNELALLFINCLEGMVDRGEFRNLVIRYQMLEHLPLMESNGIYFLKGANIPIADSSAFMQYKAESQLKRQPTFIGLGAYGRNPINFPQARETD
jgi:hypothetical protein